MQYNFEISLGNLLHPGPAKRFICHTTTRVGPANTIFKEYSPSKWPCPSIIQRTCTPQACPTNNISLFFNNKHQMRMSVFGTVIYLLLNWSQHHPIGGACFEGLPHIGGIVQVLVVVGDVKSVSVLLKRTVIVLFAVRVLTNGIGIDKVIFLYEDVQFEQLLKILHQSLGGR